MATHKPYTYAEGTRDAMTMTPSYFILARKVQKWWLANINTTPTLQAEKVVLEALELEADPSDLDEMADVFITILGLAAANGFTEHQLLDAVANKHRTNESRTWTVTETGETRHIDNPTS